jgi:hypothetical protein
VNNLAFDIGQQFLGTSNPIVTKGLGSIGDIVSRFLNISFILAGLILLFMFIVGGVGMIGSAGQSDPQKAEQAKKTLTSAVIGFVIVFTSYWIVKLIGRLIGLPNILGL